MTVPSSLVVISPIWARRQPLWVSKACDILIEFENTCKKAAAPDSPSPSLSYESHDNQPDVVNKGGRYLQIERTLP